jgi:ribose transport system ATP-binding protein
MRLDVENVRKSFPGVVALDGVSMEIRPGEIHALVGENGAGKSTFIKIVTGLYSPDQGRLLIDGEQVHFSSPRDAIAAGVSAVHQERNLIPRFSIG